MCCAGTKCMLQKYLAVETMLEQTLEDDVVLEYIELCQTIQLTLG